jgi:thioester reductase-like protein
LHELQDFSNTPSKESLQKNNVECKLLWKQTVWTNLFVLVVKTVLSLCAEEKVTTLIHISSIYLQCSAWWPNVGSRELEPQRFVRDNPFPAYFDSKYEAERLISECSKSLIIKTLHLLV